MPEIKIKNLNFSYKKGKKVVMPVLKDVNVTFLNNKINLLIGPSGCGKTTLLKSILGLATYDGDIYFDDINVKNLSIQERNVAYVNQNITLFEHMTGFENIAFPLTLLHANGDEIRERVSEIAKMLGIEDVLSRVPSQLSIGQCQRVLIAKALIKRPLICVFDEPFSNLDKPIAESIIDELKHLFKQINTTVIFVSHDVRQGLRISDRVFVMNEGKFVDEGDPSEIALSENKITRGLFSL